VGAVPERRSNKATCGLSISSQLGALTPDIRSEPVRQKRPRRSRGRSSRLDRSSESTGISRGQSGNSSSRQRSDRNLPAETKRAKVEV